MGDLKLYIRANISIKIVLIQIAGVGVVASVVKRISSTHHRISTSSLTYASCVSYVFSARPPLRAQ